MEFTQQSANQNTIISIDESTIKLSHIQLNIPCFISSKKIEEVSISSLEEISKPTGLKSESNKLKLLHADTLFIHSKPNPSSDNETCCLGERNFECFPVPIISKSSDS